MAREPESPAAEGEAVEPSQVPAPPHEKTPRFLSVVVEEPPAHRVGGALRDPEVLAVVEDDGIVVRVRVLDVRCIAESDIEAAPVERAAGPPERIVLGEGD